MPRMLAGGIAAADRAQRRRGAAGAAGAAAAAARRRPRLPGVRERASSRCSSPSARDWCAACSVTDAAAAPAASAIQGPAEGTTVFTEEQSRKNFESARRLVVPGDPDASRLLMHPLARTAGGDPFHGGGKHWASKDAPEWQTLAAWVRAGPSGHDDHRGTRLRGLPRPDRADLPQGARRPVRQGDVRRLPLGHRHAAAARRAAGAGRGVDRRAVASRTSPPHRRWSSAAIR